MTSYLTGKLHFEHLKPSDNIDISTYKAALDFSFGYERINNNSAVRANGFNVKPKKNVLGYSVYWINSEKNNKTLSNIALSGSYGAGKSSVIESYKKETEDLKFIHISLAHFTEEIQMLEEEILNNEEGNGEQVINKTIKIKEKIMGETLESKRLLEQKLEQKIVNQLLHQINSKLIPRTLFQVKENIEKKELWLNTGLVMVSIVLFMYIIFFYSVETFIYNLSNVKNLSKVTFFVHPLTQLSLIAIFIGVGTYFVYKLIQLQLNRSIIRKIKVKDNEMELLSDINDSYFDKYLNDVIYLFKNVDADVIVFEDIDRFNSVGIFEKLNEINTLANHNNHRKLSFLYLIKDDMFTSKERTKFFDMIIPVIPVVDSSNSFENMLEILEKANKNLDEKFLYKLSLYVDDMRLLKNIYNEFILYEKGVGNTTLNSEKLFSMMTYKNIFPKDFANLQLNKGFLYTIFESKEKYIKLKSAELKKELGEVNQMIKDSDAENLENIEELEVQFFFDEPAITQIGNKTRDSFKDSKEFITALKKNNFKAVYINNRHQTSYNYEEKFKSIQSHPDYQERLANIENKSYLKRRKLEQSRSEIKSRLNTVNQLNLKELISNEKLKAIKVINYSRTVDEFNNIKDSDYFPLILFLLKNGYIDESYSSYISKFYPKSLSQNDNQFIRSILDGTMLPADHVLSNTKQIVERLDPVDFTRKEIMNFDFFEYVLNNQEAYSEELKKLIANISNEGDLEFIINAFIEYTDQPNSTARERLVVRLMSQWNEFSTVLLEPFIKGNNESKINTTEQVAIDMILEGLSNVKETIALNQNKELIVTDFISNTAEITTKLNSRSRVQLTNLVSLNVKISKVDFEIIEKSLANFIYSKSLYELNEGNIKEILEFFYNLQDPDESNSRFRLQNYSLIIELKADELLTYINKKENINIYMRNYLDFSKSEDSLQDIEDDVYTILNNSDIEKTIKKEYIDKSERKLTSINKIEDKSFWQQLVTIKAVQANARNIIDYYNYQEEKWTDELTELVNSSEEVLTFDSIASEELEKMNDFKVNTALNSRLINPKYKEIFMTLRKRFPNKVLFSRIKQDKLAILIKLDLIDFNRETLIGMRQDQKNNVNIFIKPKIDDYILMLQEESQLVDEQEIIGLLSSGMIKAFEIEKKLIDLIDTPISIANAAYSEAIKKYILKTKFYVEDCSYIDEDFNNMGSALQEEVITILEKRIDKIVSGEIVIENKTILAVLLSKETIDLTIRQKLFSKKIQKFSLKEIKSLLESLKFEANFQKLFDNGRPLLNINDNNTMILEYFKQQKWITKYDPVVVEGNKYRAISRGLPRKV